MPRLRHLKLLKEIIIVLVAIGIIAGGVYLALNYFAPGTIQQETVKPTTTPKKKQQIKLVAVGDSLTQGVGDDTKQGGYVGLIKTKLTEQQHVKTKTKNYGIAGETSTQINRRVQQNTDLQQDLKRADIITLSVGGNDVMAVLKQEMLDIDEAALSTARQKYTRHLTQLLQNVRHYNAQAPIFVFSIYNPFYVYFPKMTKMQTVVTDWNKASKTVIRQQHNSYFVDVSEQLSKGEKLTTAKHKAKKGKQKNALIFTTDNFHPNHSGYQVMADDLYRQLMQQKNKWLLDRKSS